MSPVFIGITGRMHVGKSTLAGGIALSCRLANGEEPCVLPFADGVKDIARRMGWNGVKDEKGRRLLQLIGTECGRECIGENVWVDYWRKRIPTFAGCRGIAAAADAAHTLGSNALRRVAADAFDSVERVWRSAAVTGDDAPPARPEGEPS